LRGVAWLLAAFHELGHHFLHAPPDSTVAYFYKLKSNTKEENEAEAFALIALIPESLMLKLIASEEYAEDHGFPAELLKERCELYTRYKN
jgi:Zn-dependent peptidase ImmA (M78 family)